MKTCKKRSDRPAALVTFTAPPAVAAIFAESLETMFLGEDACLDDALAQGGFEILLVAPGRVFDARTLAWLHPEVRIIATYSVGHDHIDLAAAAACGLAVLHTPDVLTTAVAENAMFLLLGAARRATESIGLVRSGSWSGWTPGQLLGVELAGRRIGIVGLGRIGRAIAQRALGFGMEVHYLLRGVDVAAGDLVGHATLDALLAVSDVLLLSCALTPETRGLLNAERIARLPDGAIVVNVARGDVVDDDALLAALASGKLRAVGLDVFAGEPVIHPGYFERPEVFMLPHIGSSTIEARIAMAKALVTGITMLRDGQSPPNRIL